MSANLPPPIDGTQEYLKAIHDRLGELLDRLPAKAPQPAEGTVELREPASPSQEPEAPQVEVAEPVSRPAVSGTVTAPRPSRTPRTSTGKAGSRKKP